MSQWTAMFAARLRAVRLVPTRALGEPPPMMSAHTVAWTSHEPLRVLGNVLANPVFIDFIHPILRRIS